MRTLAHSASRLLLLASSSHAFQTGFASLRTRALRVTSPVMSDDDFAGYVHKTVFMFPGQGAQTVGMGAEVAAEVPAAA